MSSMKVNRLLIDKDFDRYVLATDGVTKHAISLPVAVLPPLEANQKLRKAQWESRVYYNALTADPFSSGSFAANVAYYVDKDYTLMQIIDCKNDGVKIENVFNFPKITTRQENVSVQVAGKGVIVYCDGHGMLYVIMTQKIQLGAKWSIRSECAPCGAVPLLVLRAFYDGHRKVIYIIVAEFLSKNEIDEAFQISMIEVFLSASVELGSEIRTADVGLQPTVTGIAIVSQLPTCVSMSDHDVVLLVHGSYRLLGSSKKLQTLGKVAIPATGTTLPHKRLHDEEALDEDEMAMLLSRFPRSGVGFHGEVSKPKDCSELASLDFNTPLSARFQKSTTPFCSVNVPPHSVPDISPRYHEDSIRNQHDRRLEVPTAESVLNGFEECDNGDVNAKASFLLLNLPGKIIQDQLDVNCSNFQFLCPSALVHSFSDTKVTLLFRNDVHGLVFELDSAQARLTLRHTATLPAFGFVQASKQEKKIMSFHPTGSLACIGEFHRRVFLYQGTNSNKRQESHIRPQYIIELGEEHLLGLHIVDTDTIFVLCSHHVYLLKLT